MARPLCRLECRASLIALAIATAGASVHLALEIAASAWRADQRVTPVHCPGAIAEPERAAPVATPPAYLEAVELRCRAAGAPRCDVAAVLPFEHAIDATRALFGDDAPDHAFLRFSPAHHRIVWSLYAREAGLTADVDAFDAAVIEFTADGVTTN